MTQIVSSLLPQSIFSFPKSKEFSVSLTKSSAFEHFFSYLSTAQGASDVLDALDYGAQVVARLPLAQKIIHPIKLLGAGCGFSSSSLWTLDLVSDGRDLLKSFSRVFDSMYQKKFYKLSKRTREFTYQAGVVTGDFFEVTKFILTCLGKTASPLFLGVSSLVWLGVDSADFVHQVRTGFRQVNEIGQIKKQKLRVKLEILQRDNLLKIVRTTSAIAIDVISIISVVFLAVQASTLVSTGILAFSIIFLAMNVSVYFYQKKHEQLFFPQPKLEKSLII